MSWTDLPEFESCPAEWEIVPLSTRADFIAGQSPDSKYYNTRGEGVPFLQGCTEFGAKYPIPEVYCTEPKKLCDSGDTLISVRAPVGTINLADQVYGLGRGLGAIHATGIEPDYLYYAMTRWHLPLRRAAQGSTFDAITARHFRQLRCCVPINNYERTAIVEHLKLADEVIDAAEAKLAAARRLKTALMQQLFTRGIPGRHMFFKQTKIGEIPQTWDVIKLKKCGTLGSGGTPDRENKSFWNGTIPWVKSGEVNYQPITETEEKITEAGAASINGELLPVGTLLIAMYGAGVTRGKAGILAVPAYVNQAIAFFKGDEKTNNNWLLYWFERNYERVRAFAGGANQDNLSLHLLKNIEIARPELEEQNDIVAIMQEASDTIMVIEKEIKALARLKCSLLQNLLTGRVRLWGQ